MRILKTLIDIISLIRDTIVSYINNTLQTNKVRTCIYKEDSIELVTIIEFSNPLTYYPILIIYIVI